MMNTANRSLGLIDLISEKHMELRKKLHEASGQPVNKSEAHILTVLSINGDLTISQTGRLIGMTRQGVHKYMQGLQAAGLVEPSAEAVNARDHHMSLTPKGLEVVRVLEETKRQLEEQISSRLGQAETELLLKLLREDWLP